MSNPTWPNATLDATSDGTNYAVGGHPNAPAFAIVRVRGEDNGENHYEHELIWRAPERDGEGEDISGTETIYGVNLDRFDLPKLVTALICAHARRDPNGVLHMLDALQLAAEDASYFETAGYLRAELVTKQRRHDADSAPVEPPEIRVSRYEQSIAVRWHDDPNWYRIEPEQMHYGVDGKHHRVGPNAFTDTPNDEWIDPFADPRPDIRRWTEPLRHQLRAALGMLDSAERHPWSG